jgi:prevent-host-death family protein
MAKRVRAAVKRPARKRSDWIAAADFKATCLELMDRVRETRAEYVVTKHGRPVARLVPYTEPKPKRFLGCLKGTVLKYERPLDPLDDEWDINRD